MLIERTMFSLHKSHHQNEVEVVYSNPKCMFVFQEKKTYQYLASFSLEDSTSYNDAVTQV